MKKSLLFLLLPFFVPLSFADNHTGAQSLEDIISSQPQFDEVEAQKGDIPVIRKPRLVFRVLDKAAASSQTLVGNVGEEVLVNGLRIKIQTCQERPPEYVPETGAFLQVYENFGSQRRLFSGWMFGSSPSLSPFENPLWDVYVLQCLDDGEEYDETKPQGRKIQLPRVPPLRPADL